MPATLRNLSARRPPFATPADLAECRAAIRTGSRSFFAASLLLPRAVFSPAIALYAFCRAADDAIDRATDALPDAVEALYRRLDLIYAGRPLPLAADRALADVAAQHAIPYAVPAALLEGFAWDVAGRRYDTIEQLEAYAARVAGSVGVMMALLMGVRDRETLGLACDLGIAMQLSNIARDVGEDARAGRLYLPRDWMRREGLDPDSWLQRPHADAGLCVVLQRLVAHADSLYARGDAGIRRLPRACRPGIRAARLLYGEIGHEATRLGARVLQQRAIVSPARKLRVLARRPPRRAAHEWVLRPAEWAGQFLVEAVPPAPPHAAPRRTLIQGLDERMAWLTDLFARLSQQET